MLSLAILALYVVPMVSSIDPTGLFGITIIVAIAAGITAAASVAFYFLKLKQETFLPSLIVYLLLTITSGILVLQTGGTHSPFIMLWMLVAFFSGLFAVYGWLTILVASAVFVASEYITGNFSANLVAIVAFSSLLPAFIGIIVWRKKGQLTENEKNVKTLTSELSEVVNQSEIVINAIGDGVIAIDAQGRIQLINPAAQEILGWNKQDAMQLNYKSILQLTDLNSKQLDPSQDPVMQVLNTNQMMRSANLIIKTKSGKKVTSSLVVSPIGSLGSGVITVFRDMTKEKAEEQEQAEFISTASHEMRTPVASIEGYLGLALNPNTAQIDAKARDFIMKAHEAAQHLGRLFQDLLDVSKSEDGRMTVVPRVVDIVPFTDMITQGLQQKATDKGLTLIFKPTADNANANTRTITPVYFVNQDNDHIREILDNLIENAIKYTPAGNVVVDVTGSDSKVIVSVKDSGLGIPAEDIPHLFQKFYRVDNQDRSAIGGTGLGLYLSRRLAEAMQGRLYLESVHGQGSTFFLELPRIDVQEAERLRAQQAQQMAAQPAAAPQPTQPAMPPVVTPYTPAQQQPVQTAPSGAPPIKAATTVPRGESLSREQIQAHVQQLQAMAREMQASQRSGTLPAAPQPVAAQIQTPQVAPTPVVAPPEPTALPPAGQQ